MRTSGRAAWRPCPEDPPWWQPSWPSPLSARTEAAGPPRPAAPVEERWGFEDGTAGGWTGHLTLAGPWPVTEWASEGTRSLKADIDLASAESYLSRVGTLDLTGYATLGSAVRTAPWGDHASGTTAKLFVTTGEGETRYDSGSTVIGTNGAMLTVDLPKAADLDDVRSVGARIARPRAPPDGPPSTSTTCR
jgi:mannan endo-1,4-beta-mannosidase